MKNQRVGSSIDWITILLYIILVIMGWMTIYSASLPIEETSLFDLSQIYGRQMLFIGLTIPIIFIILQQHILIKFLMNQFIVKHMHS